MLLVQVFQKMNGVCGMQLLTDYEILKSPIIKNTINQYLSLQTATAMILQFSTISQKTQISGKSPMSFSMLKACAKMFPFDFSLTLQNKTFLLFWLFLGSMINLSAQSLNSDKIALANYVKRMYNATPFEGVKVIDDYDHQYFVSVLSLEKAKYNNSSVMNRVAQVKAQSQANTFFNGANIKSDLLVQTTERKGSDPASFTETIETIREDATGFTRGLELLSNFDNTDNTRTIFIFFRELIK